MKKTITPGVWIGILCGLWMIIMGLTGWYKHPALLNLFWVVIPIQILVLIWGLKRTAADGATYWKQVGAGTSMSVIGGAILFVLSLLFTTVLFPSYFSDLQSMQAEILREAGTSEGEIAAMQESTASMQTPFMQAFLGLLGTVATGFISSLLIAAFVGKKTTQPTIG